jgi:hypothetical protein
MSTFQSKICLAALAAGLAACSSKADDAPSVDTGSALENALSFDHHNRHDGSIVPRLLTSSPTMESTTPANGDQNPYGVAFVPRDFPSGGLLRPHDIIVANFNNSVALGNLQGTGTTIVRTNPAGDPDLFFPADLADGGQSAITGLSTALGVLRRGFVIVGNVPSTDGTGMCAGNQSNVGPGQLTVLDRYGSIVATLDDRPFVEGPWDLTLDDHGDWARVYVSNVLTGTVTRIDLRVGCSTVVVEKEVQIASGYTHRCDPAAFVLGPTGLARDEERDVLYVASTADNNIFAIRDAGDRCTDAGMGEAVVHRSTADKYFHGPLGLVRAANGHLISSQGDAVRPDPAAFSEIVEVTAEGHFVAQIQVDPNAGGAFGLALEQKPWDPDDFRFAAVDDNVPTLDVWTLR